MYIALPKQGTLSRVDKKDNVNAKLHKVKEKCEGALIWTLDKDKSGTKIAKLKSLPGKNTQTKDDEYVDALIS